MISLLLVLQILTVKVSENDRMKAGRRGTDAAASVGTSPGELDVSRKAMGLFSEEQEPKQAPG